MLAGLGLSDPVSSLLPIKANTPHPTPTTAIQGVSREALSALFAEQGVRQIPIIDAAGQPVEVVTVDDFALGHKAPPLRAVVMAGGFGKRLHPLTSDTPKPMLPVGGRPLLEVIIGQLRDRGIKSIYVSTHFREEKIIEHLGDGSGLGVDISYLREESPLGTAGALGLMPTPTEPLLVINGDILTDLDFRSMHCYHEKLKAKLTIAVRRYQVQVPYGVVDSDGTSVIGIREKPELGFFVNAGIYLLEPDVYNFIPQNSHFNMTDLIDRLIAHGEKVGSFPLREYWLDIGQRADYDKAQRDLENRGLTWIGERKS